jgi:hypothetical protein
MVSMHFATEPWQIALQMASISASPSRSSLGTETAKGSRSMQNTVLQQPVYFEETAPVKPAFKYFIACEDNAALVRAKKVQDQVEALCDGEIEVSRLVWNFAFLRHEQLRKFAVTEASGAEMIVVSLRAGSELPPHVKLWMESLPVRPQPGRAAFVALIGSKMEGWPKRCPHVAYFQQVAESRGLDFFCNQDDWDRLALSKTAVRSGEDDMVTPENIISQHIPWVPVGINNEVNRKQMNKTAKQYENKIQ